MFKPGDYVKINWNRELLNKYGIDSYDLESHIRQNLDISSDQNIENCVFQIITVGNPLQNDTISLSGISRYYFADYNLIACDSAGNSLNQVPDKELTIEEISKMKPNEFYDNYFEKYRYLIQNHYYIHTKGYNFKLKNEFIDLLKSLFGGTTNMAINSKSDGKKITLAFLKNKEILDGYVEKIKKIKHIQNLFVEERRSDFIYGFTRNMELNILRIKNLIFEKDDSLIKELVQLSKIYHDNIVELRKLYDDYENTFDKIEDLGRVVAESLKNLEDFKQTVLNTRYNLDVRKFNLVKNRKALIEKLKKIQLPKNLNELRQITIYDIENNNPTLEQYQNTKLLLSKQKQNEKIPRAL